VRGCSGGGERHRWTLANRLADLPPNSAVVVTNPEEDCSTEAFHALLDDLVGRPDPELDSIGGASALRALRVDAES
jgi:hypothetical protein